jgi:hypothetical protein
MLALIIARVRSIYRNGAPVRRGAVVFRNRLHCPKFTSPIEIAGKWLITIRVMKLIATKGSTPH